MTHTKSLTALALALVAMGVEAAAPTITTAVWLPQEGNKLRVLGEAGVPGERVYVRIPETVGNRHVQADGSFRFNKTGVYPPPCEVHLLPQGGTPGPVHTVADPRDFAVGDAIKHECMPTDDKAVIDASESGELPGLGVTTLLDMPTDWCRFDVGAEQRLYWPHTGAGCAPTQEHMDTITGMSVGKSQWVGLGCSMPIRTTVFIVPFTTAFSAFVGGAATPDWGDGHILVDIALSAESPEATSGSVLHEITHVAQFKEGFTLAELSFTVWSEAVAVAAMMRGMPDSLYWVDAHKEWPVRWASGMTYGRDQSRQLGLFFRYLESAYPLFNACTFMQTQKTTLKAGDEIIALRAELALYDSRPDALDILWGKFVTAYNFRNPLALPGIEALGPPDVFPEPPYLTNDGVAYNLNGAIEGDTFVISLSDNLRNYLARVHSPRCHPVSAQVTLNYVSTRPDGYWEHVSSEGVFPAGDGQERFTELSITGSGFYGVTVSSLAGAAHFSEMLIANSLNPMTLPITPWPLPDINDPWQGTACP